MAAYKPERDCGHDDSPSRGNRSSKAAYKHPRRRSHAGSGTASRSQSRERSAGVDSSSDRFSCKHADTLNGGEDGDNSSLGIDIHESELEPQLGTDGESDVSHDAFGDECELPLELEGILERFSQSTRIRLKAQTGRGYSIQFRRFWAEKSLEGTTKRELSRNGQKLLLEFLETVPKRSWRTVLSALASVWKYGIGLPWPIDAKRDLPRLPRVGRRATPSDALVRKWHDAIRREPDIYLKLEWLMLAQHGWRPQHLCRIKWKHLLRDDNGRPYALVAEGFEEDFKTHASIACSLCPEVVEALAEWEKEIGTATSLESPILPFRNRAKRLFVNREQSTDNVRGQWKRIQARHGLQPLLPCQMRHFASTACRRAGLSKQSTAYLQGHDPTQGGCMRDWYDAPGVEEAFCEQAERIPNGPLGVIEPPEIEVTDGLPKAVSAMVSQFLDGSVGTLELMKALDECRTNLQKASQPKVER
jgi:integrase